ncbi:MAG: RHS repeat-associated core domain-containing protein [Mycobacteriales bacterium]
MRPPSRAIAAALGLALTAGLTAALPPAAAPAATPWPAHKPDEPYLVKGFPVPAKPRPSDPATAKSAPAPPAPSWPAAGTATVTVPAAAPAAARAGSTTAPETAPETAKAGHLPVLVGPPATPAAARAATAATEPLPPPAAVRVRLLDRKAAAKRGVDGLLLRVRRADGVATAGPVSLSVDYSAFRHAYGGDWATRLRLVEVPATGPARVLPTRNDTKAGQVSADVAVAATDTTVALTAAPNGQTGDYRATSLSPSGKWSVDTQSGDFTWSYPLKVPDVPGQLGPDLALDYSSGQVDGRTAGTNNQTSWIGEGWEMGPGYVERSFRACYDDTTVAALKTGDECWAGDNATLSLGGHSSPLIHVADNLWRPKDDDGSRVERVVGGVDNGDNDNEDWKVTTTDGTQYWFGRSRESAWSEPVFGNDTGEPCHQSTFAASSCQQAYRWNLDQVVDTHGNQISYFWGPEYNNYSLDLDTTRPTRYTRGGVLLRAEYGNRAGEHPTGQVLFTTAERGGPDVPSDQACADGANCGEHYSPTFWSTRKLTTVTTQVWNGSAWQDVDRWDLNQSYPGNEDGTTASLWLNSITHTGLASGQNVVGGPIAEPPVTFGGTQLPNRVNSDSDGMMPLDKWRIHHIDTESGGTIWVNYANPDCLPSAKPDPANNSLRCFPVIWSPNDGKDLEVHDWMHKYVVSSVAQEDRVGGEQTQVTEYDYIGGAGWRLEDDPVIPAAKQTWSRYRGYEKVVVRAGDANKGIQSATQYQYFRGLGKAKVTDSQGVAMDDPDQLAGFLRERIDYDGVGGPVVTDTINDPWQHGPSATQGPWSSYLIRTGRTVTRTMLKPTGVRTTEKDSQFTDQGLPTTVSDLGDVSTPADDQCTTDTYAQNTGAWLLEKLADVRVDGVACGVTPSYPADAISDHRTYYDNARTLSAAPTKGDITWTEELAGYNDSKLPIYLSALATFDAYGRLLTSTDALSRKTTRAYDPPTGLPTTTTVTDPKNNATASTTNLTTGQPVDTVDPNDRHTSQTYDALGRVLGVWKPGRGKDAGDGPNVRYTYGLPANGPAWVSTDTLKPNNNYVTGYQLFDGFLRPRQTQAPGPNTAGKPPLRVLTDTLYDSRGLTVQANGPYSDDGTPGTAVVGVNDNDLPTLTRTTFDGVGRSTRSEVMSKGTAVATTTTAYFGDHVETTPPAGGTPTAVYTDARGQATEQWQYRGATPAGNHDVTRYSYDRAGNLAQLTDAVGNTWRYTHDLIGRQTSVVDPDKGRATMTYDPTGQIASTTDARNVTLAYRYDELGRKTEEHENTLSGKLLASWTYDTILKGQPTSTTRYEGDDAYTTTVTGYDAAYRPKGRTLTLPASQSPTTTGAPYAYTVGYTYKADGSPDTVTMPSLPGMTTETLTYGYDSLGFPITLKGGSTNYVHDAAYTAYGELSQIQSGDAPRQALNTYYFDLATRRTTRAVTDSQRPDATVTVADVNYGYDPAGNVTQTADAAAGTTPDVQCFGYDAERRLTDAWTIAATSVTTPCGAPGANAGGPIPYWTTYGYDAIGNRLSETPHAVASTLLTGNHSGGSAVATPAALPTRTYSYPAPGSARPHAVASVTSVRPASSTGIAAAAATTDYQYDAAGNTISRPGPTGQQTLTWTREGKLDTVASATDTSGNHYDAESDLVASRDGAGVTAYLDGAELHLDAVSKKATGTRYYTFGGDTVAVRTTSTGLSWLAHDQHGTDTVAVTADTSVASVRRSDPFGNPRGAQPASWPTTRGFVGGIQQVTGTTHLGDREYDPALGRFLSVDPVLDPADPQQVNAYSYANNNPTTMSDPTGRYLSECDNCGYVDAGKYHGPGYTAGDGGGGGSHGGGSHGGSGGGSHHGSGKKKYGPYPVMESFGDYFPGLKPKPQLPDLLDPLLHPLDTPDYLWGVPEALLGPLIPPGPEGDAARKALYAESVKEAEAAGRRSQREQDEADARRRAAHECARSIACTARGMASDIGNFVKDHKEAIVHFGVSLGVSIATGVIAAGVCAGSLGIGCGLVVGVALGATFGVGTNAAAAYAMHEDITPGKLSAWAMSSIPMKGIQGIRGVTGTTMGGLFRGLRQADLGGVLKGAWDKMTDPAQFWGGQP